MWGVAVAFGGVRECMWRAGSIWLWSSCGGEGGLFEALHAPGVKAGVAPGKFQARGGSKEDSPREEKPPAACKCVWGW